MEAPSTEARSAAINRHSWARRAIRRMLRGAQVVASVIDPRRNYVVLTPAGATRQLVLDRRHRRVRRYHTRGTNVDHLVLQQIFEAEDYRLTLGRGPEIVTLYERCLAANATPLIIDCG